LDAERLCVLNQTAAHGEMFFDHPLGENFDFSVAALVESEFAENDGCVTVFQATLDEHLVLPHAAECRGRVI
jgi:hypothetical protein